MTKGVTEGEGEAERVPHTVPIPTNISLAQMGKQGTTGWELSSCCDGFSYYILEGFWFTPKWDLSNTVASPKDCYALLLLPGQQCSTQFFYANSGEPAPYGGKCRCTSADNSWSDLSIEVTDSGSSIYWPTA